MSLIIREVIWVDELFLVLLCLLVEIDVIKRMENLSCFKNYSSLVKMN